MDSGGFRMVSLSRFSRLLEEGVLFQSPVDGTKMLLTPEKNIGIQNDIGADIVMALDDVVPSTLTGLRVKEAYHPTLRFIDPCATAHAKKESTRIRYCTGRAQRAIAQNLLRGP